MLASQGSSMLGGKVSNLSKMENTGDRIRQARKAAGLTAAELAHRVGVTKSAVLQWESGATKNVRPTNLWAVSHATGCSAEWLIYGGSHQTEDEHRTKHAAGRVETHANVSAAPEATRRIPIISWVQAGHWHEAIDLHHPGEAEEWQPTTKTVGERAFYLRVEGDSMLAPHGRGYPPGCLVLVDPDTAPDPGRRVVARHVETSEVTFKELAYDAGQYYLKPLNPQYQMIEIDSEWEVIGVVRETIVQED